MERIAYSDGDVAGRVRLGRGPGAFRDSNGRGRARHSAHCVQF